MRQLSKKIREKVKDIEAIDKQKASYVQQEILYPIEQQRMDIIQHMGVCMQASLAFEIMKRNNYELIRVVDRTATTTVYALKTAVMVDGALSQQEKVLDAVEFVNETTSKYIENTSEKLKNQGTKIHKKASEALIDPKKMDKAFQNVFAAMDALDKYKEDALPKMEATITSLEKTLDKAKDYFSEQRRKKVEDVAQEILPTNDDNGAVSVTGRLKKNNI